MNDINIRSWFNRLFHLLQCSHFKYFSSRWAHLIYCFIYCNAHICSVSRLGEHIQSKEKINWTKSSQVLSPSLIILHYLLHAYLISFLSFVAKKSCYTRSFKKKWDCFCSFRLVWATTKTWVVLKPLNDFRFRKKKLFDFCQLLWISQRKEWRLLRSFARTLSIINLSTKLMELSRISLSNAYINLSSDIKS